MQKIFTVSNLAVIIKHTIETNFSTIKIKGEISNISFPKSGHVYFDLKDEFASLSAICWRDNFRRLKFTPENGIEVLCNGRITTYHKQSKYQLIADDIQIAGIGAIMAMIEKRKVQLEAEGLFKHKKSLPKLPSVIGVVTSITGAVFQDICVRLKARFGLRIIIWPVQVQGKEATQQMCEAIRGFNDKANNIPCPDLIIIARGGGSIEDLWPFNEEDLVRAVACSEIPTISAIGHETDTTLVDYASDLRSPTPTASVEDATPVKSELYDMLNELTRRLLMAMERYVMHKSQMLIYLSKRSASMRPDINAGSELLIAKTRMIHIMMMRIWQRCYKQLLDSELKTDFFERRAKELSHLSNIIAPYNYNENLRKGYVLAYDAHGKMITRASELKAKQKMRIRFYDETKTVTVIDEA